MVHGAICVGCPRQRALRLSAAHHAVAVNHTPLPERAMMTPRRTARLAFALTALAPSVTGAQAAPLRVGRDGVARGRGLDVLVFNNYYGQFGDEKISGVELIHHGVRTATNGDVRLSPTPEQWDPTPRLAGRDVDTLAGRVTARLAYTAYDFS